jgi:murein DD-endopeptidase MepM/ murein hydrolase activator NlpD
MQKITFFIAVFWFSLGLFSQREYPSYHPPLKIPLILAGNFGELRPNHFHMGVDFKTQGKEGFELHSIEDGYVSRVKVSTFGYGKVVYINHANGKTSVYAHCSKFTGKLDSIVRVEQYKTRNFEIELFPEPGKIPLKKGEVFALSGNTGGSTAPHLHFEIRDTKTEYAQNPLVYGFDLPDTRAPEIRKVKAFAINEQGYLIPGKSIEKSVLKTKDGYAISGDTLKIISSFCSSFGGIGLAFDVIDRLNGTENQCGLYGTFLIVDGDTVFGQRTNEISFDHSRYINSHRDLSSTGQVHKSFRNISNPLEIYIDDNLGVISIQPGEAKNIRFIAYDPKGNTSVFSFVLQALSGEMSENYNPSVEKYWYPENVYSRKTKTWEVHADSFSIYEPYLINNKETPHICDVGTHLQNRISVRMKLESAKVPLEKYYIAVTSKGGKKSLLTTYSDGWLEAKTNNAGHFSIHVDETPPVIKPLTTSYNITTKTVRFSVVESQTLLADCDLYINGEWHLLEYEYKGNYVFFEVPSELKGINEVKIIAKDTCGNEAIWEKPMNFN